MRNWCFWIVGLSCQGSSTVSCYPGSVLMRTLSPFSNALNEDNAASNHEDLLIPANLAAAEEAAVSKVSPPAGLEGFSVSRCELPMPPGKHSRLCCMPLITQWIPVVGECQRVLSGADRDTVQISPKAISEYPFRFFAWHLCFWSFSWRWWGAPYIPVIWCSRKRLQGWNSDTGNSY